jgi:rhodanese-related sulfurtransferase
VAQELTKRSYRNVHPLYGGFGAWLRAGFPLEQK